MASYLDKTQINTAITDNTKLDLGHSHISTADFMQANVSYLHEMVPGERIDVAMETFSRLNPLPVPTFGRASIRNRAYFVPFRTIFRGFNDFITDSVHVASDGFTTSTYSLISNCPTVDMSELSAAFTTSVGTALDSPAMCYPAGTAADCDFQLGIQPNEVRYNFTVIGRQCIKLLEQLGYKIDWSAKVGDYVMSAMPLLALAKVYCDWMFPQQYSNISAYDTLLSLCNLDVDAGPLSLTQDKVRLILTVCSFVQYDSDYFVSAWDTPNQPNPGNHSDFQLRNIDSITQSFSEPQSASVTYPSSSAGYVSNNSGNATLGNAIGGADAPFISPVTAVSTSKVALTPISQYLLHSLHALTDYMKRHQLAGSRSFDRYLARFGKALPAEKLNRSVYLGAGVQNVQIGDIMSTSDTEGAQLGAFAGKGISYGNSHFEYSTDEFGYLIIVTSIVPATGYFQGIDRQVMRTTKLDFWTPEFDSLGSQPITAAELYIPQWPTDMALTPSTTSAYRQVFGFAPRYADYKVAHDQLTGNFRLLSVNGGSPRVNAADSWHLMRTFEGISDFTSNYENVVHSPDFISGKADFSQYKRIFYDDEATAPDNFTLFHNFEIAAYVPMKPLYDNYEFEDKGKKVTMEVNGVKHN